MTNKIRIRNVALSLALIAVSSSALAQTTPAEQAAEMLARIQSIDMKCGYLDAADKDALSNLVARAELALANREPVAATKETMQRGHAAGLAASCSASEKHAVITVLSAARQASAPQPARSSTTLALPAPPIAADAAPALPPVDASVAMPKDKISAQPKSKIATQEPVAPLLPHIQPIEPHQVAGDHVKISKATAVKKVKPATVTSGGLQNYAKMTEAYYLILRCSGDRIHTSDLYATIVAAHSNLMQSHAAKEVSAALRRAKAEAGGQNCT